MSKDCKYSEWLNKSAQTQQQRFHKNLNPAKLQLMDFDIEEWMLFTYHFAEKVHYFDESNSINPSDHWQHFFKAKNEIYDFLKQLEEGETTPHLALFVCFLYLLRLPKASFNQLTKRHLNYYYEEVLQIKRKDIVPDQVFLVFDLAKNLSQTLIEANVLVDAGKDLSGKRRVYALEDELVANQARVTELKSVLHHLNGKESELVHAPIANSLDGLGQELEENGTWHVFGYPTSADSGLPKPRIGFLLSSEVLRMAEGARTVTAEFIFDNIDNDNLITKEDLINCLSVQLTGEEKWIDAELLPDLSINNTRLSIQFSIDASEKPITNYSEETHELRLSTNQPTALFQIDLNQEHAYLCYEFLSTIKASDIQLKVDVKGVSALHLENDQGNINAQKPFFPFGTIPVKNSNFTIKYPEVFAKDWQSIRLNAEWKNLPEDIVAHYDKYRKPAGSAKIVADLDYFEAPASVLGVSTIENFTSTGLFPNNGSEFSIEITPNLASKAEAHHSIRLTLVKSFLHEMYPKIYTLAIIKPDVNEDDIPNEPYTPMMEQISMDYEARATWINANHLNSRISVFHLHPFGVSSVLETENIELLPKYEGGYLYIGLENAQVRQQISLLFQLAEGTENPLAEFYAKGKGLSWAVLTNNQWKNLQKDEILKNESNNLLKSGIFTFVLPAEATDNNTLLPAGKHWLRLQHQKSYDSVCKLVGVHAQAVRAQFQNKGNSLEHLIDALPAKSMAKLVVRLADIKKVAQPYATFGGRREESDSQYYVRVSERLRHKNRAITPWDYEHLVLEQFPKVHKVKCLSHSSPSSFFVPGHTTLIVVPNTANQDLHDVFQPRLSMAVLNEIAAFLNKKNSLHVTAHVENPSYEEIKITLHVQFNAGLDPDFYEKKLELDLQKLLSPWAFYQQTDITFEAKIYRSQLIYYIEKLPYVDFISDLSMTKSTSKSKDEPIKDALPSCPRAIIVSAKKHNIKPIDKTCPQLSINQNQKKKC